MESNSKKINSSEEAKKPQESATECDSAPCTQVVASEVDGLLFKKPKDYSQKNVVYTDLDPLSEVYNMNHARRGVAIIFNHVNIKKMVRRTGSQKDVDALSDTLKTLGFEVRVYLDPTLESISRILQSAAAEDYTNADCLIVVAMSHGQSDCLYSSDNNIYPVDILWTSFTGNRCPSLAGKPKLFFIQACRGSDLDSGVQMVHQTDSVGSTYSLPIYADILVAYSSYEGHYSFRNPENGSWFVQELCKELKRNWQTRDLLWMMTSTIRRVAIKYESFSPENKKFHGKKQVPSVVSMLTRLLYFGQVPAELLKLPTTNIPDQ
ncbi:caspase-1 [Xylocopa sonorina]|uniref:caspase-1 n=1 Tax=Xylocopa sonorina TaxID=1818115 RepID=UPI00403AB17F